MKYEEMASHDLRFELTLDSIKNDNEARLEIENELLRRQQQGMEERMRQEAPTLKNKFKKFVFYIFVLITIIFCFLMYSGMKGGTTHLHEYEASHFVSQFVKDLTTRPTNESLFKVDPKILENGGQVALITLIEKYKAEFPENPIIKEVKLIKARALTGIGVPDYLYRYSVAVQHGQRLVLLFVEVAYDEVFSVRFVNLNGYSQLKSSV